MITSQFVTNFATAKKDPRLKVLLHSWEQLCQLWAPGALLLFAVFVGGVDESGEEGVGAVGTGFEFGVELAGNEPGMVRQFDHLDDAVVGRGAADQDA